MAESRVDITIAAENRAQGAFNQTNRELQKTTDLVKQARDQMAALNKQQVYADNRGQYHDLRTGQYVGKLTDQMVVVDKAIGRARLGLGGLTDTVRRGKGPLDNYAAGIGNTHVQLIALGVASRSVDIAIRRTIVTQAREAVNLERLNLSLKAISGSYAEAAKQRQRLIVVSREPGINIESALKGTLQLQALGLEGAKAVEVIGEIGNALALSGQQANQLFPALGGLRQIVGVGKILQEDLEILTSRIPILARELNKEFGSSRAEQIRKYYDALGVPENQQGARFLEDILRILRPLERASDTTSNAIENLNDTVQRMQAEIGKNFVPIVRDATRTFEGWAKTVEDNPGLAKGIAQAEVFAGVMGKVALGIGGIGVAAKALGPGIVAGFSHPLGIAALAVGGLTAALLAWRVGMEDTQGPIEAMRQLIDSQVESVLKLKAAQDEAREAQVQLSEAQADGAVDSETVAKAQSNLASAQERLTTAQRERLAAAQKGAAERNQIITEQTEQAAALRAELQGLDDERAANLRGGQTYDASEVIVGDVYPEIAPEERILRRRREILGRRRRDGVVGFLPGGELQQAETIISIAEIELESLHRVINRLKGSTEETGDAIVETLDSTINGLTAIATTGADAIAKQLERLDNFQSEVADQRKKALALDIGDRLVEIADAKDISDLKGQKTALDSLIRSNRLLIDEEESLQTLVDSTNTAIQGQLSQLLQAVPVGAADRADRLREIALFAREVGASAVEEQAKQGLLAAAQTAKLQEEIEKRTAIQEDFNTFQTRISKLQSLDQINSYNRDVKAFKESLIQKGFALEEFAHIFESLHSQMLAKGAIIATELRAEANQQVIDELSAADAAQDDEKFDRGFRALSELRKIKDLKALRERFQVLEESGQFNLGPEKSGSSLAKINRALPRHLQPARIRTDRRCLSKAGCSGREERPSLLPPRT